MLQNRSEEPGHRKKIRKENGPESGYFFNMKYFEEKVLSGNWDELDHYLARFTNADDNRYSTQLYFDIRLQKFLGALDSNDKNKAAEILVKDLKVLSRTGEDIYKDLTHLLELDSFSENKYRAAYPDTITMRTKKLVEFKKWIATNPAIQEKLDVPIFYQNRSKTLADQSLNWKQTISRDPRLNPSCAPTNQAHATIPVTLQVGAVENPSAHCPSIATAKAIDALEESIKNAPELLQGEGSDPAKDESRTLEDAAADEGNAKELTEIVELSKCLVLPIQISADPSNKVAQLLYSYSGIGIFALGSSGMQTLWKWNTTVQNPKGKATASIVPRRYEGMMNDVSKVNLKKAVPCIALSRNDEYMISSCGGSVSLFKMRTLKALKSFMRPPPTPIFLAFHPKDHDTAFIVMSNIDTYVYNVFTEKVKAKLRGHKSRITGLAFSTKLNILVTSSRDNSLIIWNTDSWTKQRKCHINLPEAKTEFKIEFHPNQVRLLVFCETVLAMYDVSDWKLIQKWVSVSVSLSCATCSCNGEVVYAAFRDGNVGVFDAESLRLRCRISPSAYLASAALNSQNVTPVVIAAHPTEADQFALGMTDGTIKVIEPDPEHGTWNLTSEPD